MSKRFLIFFITCFIFLIFLGWQFVSPKDTESNTVKVYFFKGERLITVNRPVPVNGSRIEFALKQLFLGPNFEEQTSGIFTQIPKNLNFKDLRLATSLITIIFDDSLKAVSGGTSLINGMLAQIVYTALQFSHLNYVDFELENRQDPIIIGGEGIVIDEPLSRQNFKEFE